MPEIFTGVAVCPVLRPFRLLCLRPFAKLSMFPLLLWYSRLTLAEYCLRCSVSSRQAKPSMPFSATAYFLPLGYQTLPLCIPPLSDPNLTPPTAEVHPPAMAGLLNLGTWAKTQRFEGITMRVRGMTTSSRNVINLVMLVATHEMTRAQGVRKLVCPRDAV